MSETETLPSVVEPQGGVPTITYTKAQMDLIKRTYASEATDDELALFVHASKRLSLDILARQIHFTKRGGKVVFIVSIDGYRLNAERTGNYAPGKEPSYAYDKDGKVLSATAYVKKFVKGEWHEIAATAFMEEYKPDEKSDWMWKKMPHNQLAKCAEALVLRRAYPKDLGDTVTDVEMAQVREPAKAEPIAGPEAAKPAEKKEAPKSDAKTESGDTVYPFSFIPERSSAKGTKKEGQTRYAVLNPNVKDEWLATFSDDLGKIAVSARENKQTLAGHYKMDGAYKTIVDCEIK